MGQNSSPASWGSLPKVGMEEQGFAYKGSRTVRVPKPWITPKCHQTEAVLQALGLQLESREETPFPKLLGEAGAGDITGCGCQSPGSSGAELWDVFRGPRRTGLFNNDQLLASLPSRSSWKLWVGLVGRAELLLASRDKGQEGHMWTMPP